MTLAEAGHMALIIRHVSPLHIVGADFLWFYFYFRNYAHMLRANRLAKAVIAERRKTPCFSVLRHSLESSLASRLSFTFLSYMSPAKYISAREPAPSRAVENFTVLKLARALASHFGLFTLRRLRMHIEHFRIYFAAQCQPTTSFF